MLENVKGFKINRNTCLSVFFVLHVMALVHKVCTYFVFGENEIEMWGMSEWLLNYQGGFVRRGLAGEFIYQMHTSFGIDARILSIAISLAAFILLAFFFCTQFVKKEYPIFILPLSLFLGNPIVNSHWLRKDSFLLLLLVGVLRRI